MKRILSSQIFRSYESELLTNSTWGVGEEKERKKKKAESNKEKPFQIPAHLV